MYFSDLQGHLDRWIMTLSAYDFTVKYLLRFNNYFRDSFSSFIEDVPGTEGEKDHLSCFGDSSVIGITHSGKGRVLKNL